MGVNILQHRVGLHHRELEVQSLSEIYVQPFLLSSFLPFRFCSKTSLRLNCMNTVLLFPSLIFFQNEILLDPPPHDPGGVCLR